MTLGVLALDWRFGAEEALAPLELQTLDWRFRLRGPEAPSGEVVLVLADDPTLAELGTWPPSRAVIASAVDRLARAGARVILVNLLLAEAPGGTPSEADHELARTIAAAGNVVLAYAFVPSSDRTTTPPDWLGATAYRVRAGPDRTQLRPAGLILPDPWLGRAAASLGHVSLLLEADGSLRADLPAVTFGGELYPSAAVEAARLALGLDRDDLAADGSREIVLGTRTIPLDGHGRQLLDHLGPEKSLPTWSLADLLAYRLVPALLRDRIVVLGVSAAGAGDRFTTPFAARLPGSEHVATALDNLLTGRVLRHGPEVRALDRLLTALVAILAALLAGRRSPWWSLGVLALLLAGLATVLQFAFVLELLWLSALPPAAALLFAGIGVELLRVGEERHRRRHLERQRANLARYFPPAVVDRLAASDSPAGLDRIQEAVVMFVDIMGFTRLSEAMAPGDALALLRRFHIEVERAVFAHGGMVDKFLGDGAMACFGVPDPSPTAAADAIGAALALLDALAAAPPPRLRVGIGIHAGPVLMGDVGGATQFQFTVVGDTVNVASRLEELTRECDSPLIVSEQAFRLAGPPQSLADRFEPLPELAIRGRAGTVSGYRLT
ncbi:MAG: CHASE2 domain-containing protein [Geminicoccaceae bacterium]